jgi:hypothetical protein
MAKMKIYYQFLEDKNLLIHKFLGAWSTEHYENYIDMSINTLNMNNIKKIFTDLREIDLETTLEDEENIRRIRNKITNTDYLNVHLVVSPLTTAISHIYQEKFVAEGLNYKYCSTTEQALKLLDLDFGIDEMENLLKSLENQF